MDFYNTLRSLQTIPAAQRTALLQNYPADIQSVFADIISLPAEQLNRVIDELENYTDEQLEQLMNTSQDERKQLLDQILASPNMLQGQIGAPVDDTDSFWRGLWLQNSSQ